MKPYEHTAEFEIRLILKYFIGVLKVYNIHIYSIQSRIFGQRRRESHFQIGKNGTNYFSSNSEDAGK